MKKSILGLSFISLLFLTITAFHRPPSPAADDTATVYVYRVGQFGAAAANWSIWADGKKICKLSNNKFIMAKVQPGKHVFTAKIGGMSLLKKETEIEIDAEAGQSYYIACNVKQSITRARLEMIEVTKHSAEKQMEKMSLDNCQERIDEKE